MSDSVHIPVLANEILDLLDLQPGQIVVDGTLGGGGHTRLFAERVGPTGKVIAMDRDIVAIERARRELQDLPVLPVHANFCNLPELLEQYELPPPHAALLDLGLSSDQLADDSRGFSFNSSGPLDMRFDVERGEPAWRLIERLSEKHLADLIYQYGEERHSRRIARRLVEARNDPERGGESLKSTEMIANIVRRAIPGPRQRIDGATRTFQALRIAVNEELKSLEIALNRYPECMHAGAKLAIISFHSLEDRRVKEAFQTNDRFATITRRVVRATETEISSNPRSRSAKLRVAEILVR